MIKLLSIQEAAEILGISYTTAKIWASKRKIPVIKVGRLVRISPAALEDWIESHSIPVASSEVGSRQKRVIKQKKHHDFDRALQDLLEDRS